MSDDNQEREEIRALPGRGASETEIKHAAALILSDAGLGPTAIGTAIERTPQHVCTTLKELKKESLASPGKVKLASKAVDRVLKGFIGETVTGPDGKALRDDKGKVIQVTDRRVKASDVMRAAELIYSRAEPSKQEGIGGTSQTFIQVNMNVFRKQE